MPRRAGFTLVEMMIVLGVLAILALMAVPGMRDTTLRKQVKDGMALADVAKGGVQLAWTLGGQMPANNKEAGVPEPAKIVGTLVKSVNIDHGAITVTFGNNAGKSLHDKRLTLRPAVVPDEPTVPIAWLCHSANVPKGMQVLGRDETDLPSEWLPVECRAGP